MEKYWALDYVDELECELVVDAQLYPSEEAAAAAREKLSHPELYEITWYTFADLVDNVFGTAIEIDEDLHISCCEC